MIAVIFELTPRAGANERCFELAVALKPTLDAIAISAERFERVTRPGRYVSLSLRRNEEAVREWRRQSSHRGAQREGRDAVFADYRLRVAAVLRDYGLHDRAQAPVDSRAALL
ncbi:MAG: antibiotic biosynthesis monooxygenase [Rhizobacter sp.]|nr:antibiotic biosynthesis monooxygenase [Rhizobacter sp.]